MTAIASEAGAFQSHRSYLLGIAYRMLGSLSEAEDIVQEVWIRWSRRGAEEIVQPRAWLRTVTTRLCLDQLKCARLRREEYVGPWLPEPLPEHLAAEIGEPILAADITMSLMLALERLTPPERAAFLLHDIFDVPFAEIATTLCKPETACRQLATRARRQVRGSRKRFQHDHEAAERLTAAFLKAAGDGDAEALKAILADDVVIYTDGGGIRPAALNVISGAERATRFFIGSIERPAGGCRRSSTAAASMPLRASSRSSPTDCRRRSRSKPQAGGSPQFMS